MATNHNISGSPVTEVNTDDPGVDIQHQILVESLNFL